MYLVYRVEFIEGENNLLQSSQSWPICRLSRQIDHSRMHLNTNLTHNFLLIIVNTLNTFQDSRLTIWTVKKLTLLLHDWKNVSWRSWRDLKYISDSSLYELFISIYMFSLFYCFFHWKLQYTKEPTFILCFQIGTGYYILVQVGTELYTMIQFGTDWYSLVQVQVSTNWYRLIRLQVSIAWCWLVLVDAGLFSLLNLKIFVSFIKNYNLPKCILYQTLHWHESLHLYGSVWYRLVLVSSDWYKLVQIGIVLVNAVDMILISNYYTCVHCTYFCTLSLSERELYK